MRLWGLFFTIVWIPFVVFGAVETETACSKSTNSVRTSCAQHLFGCSDEFSGFTGLRSGFLKEKFDAYQRARTTCAKVRNELFDALLTHYSKTKETRFLYLLVSSIAKSGRDTVNKRAIIGIIAETYKDVHSATTIERLKGDLREKLNEFFRSVHLREVNLASGKKLLLRDVPTMNLTSLLWCVAEIYSATKP